MNPQEIGSLLGNSGFNFKGFKRRPRFGGDSIGGTSIGGRNLGQLEGMPLQELLGQIQLPPTLPQNPLIKTGGQGEGMGGGRIFPPLPPNLRFPPTLPQIPFRPPITPPKRPI